MSTVHAFDPEYRLPEHERARLRSSVDVTALERLLAHLSANVRPVVLAYCRRDTTDAEHAAAMAPFPGDDASPPDGDGLRFQRPRFLEPHLAALWRAAVPELAR